ncbi:TetR family transcriptional regulator [Streptomyces sp. NPDC090032]|uniref:TetR family transcriptional regulator n=1 Tax=Streptomyces sp. NPDC090032 TaxID=3365925 RepID=UPI003806AF12
MAVHCLPGHEANPSELLHAASTIAVSEGLDKPTVKRVAQAVGVIPGLVDHHFKSADELAAAVFSHAATFSPAATAGNEAVFERAIHRERGIRASRREWATPRCTSWSSSTVSARKPPVQGSTAPRSAS